MPLSSARSDFLLQEWRQIWIIENGLLENSPSVNRMAQTQFQFQEVEKGLRVYVHIHILFKLFITYRIVNLFNKTLIGAIYPSCLMVYWNQLVMQYLSHIVFIDAL